MSLGIDIVPISRMEVSEYFIEKILSTNELKIFEKRVNKKEFLAGRFAAKEAFMKANGVGMIGENCMKFSEIEVLEKETGQPYIVYKQKVYDVSISHDGGIAIAIVNI